MKLKKLNSIKIFKELQNMMKIMFKKLLTLMMLKFRDNGQDISAQWELMLLKSNQLAKYF